MSWAFQRRMPRFQFVPFVRQGDTASDCPEYNCPSLPSRQDRGFKPPEERRDILLLLILIPSGRLLVAHGLIGGGQALHFTSFSFFRMARQ